jgi:hypothetical protein
MTFLQVVITAGLPKQVVDLHGNGASIVLNVTS